MNKVEHIEIINEWGNTLRGYLTKPDNFNGEIIVMFHGYTGNKTEHGNHFKNFSRIIAQHGFASLRMDFYGNGESDGEFYDFTFDTMYSDAQKMIDYCFKLEGVKKVNLLGFSMGGACATMMSSLYGNKISKIILWSSACNIIEHIKKYYENQLKKEPLPTKGTFEISKEMNDSLDKYNTMTGIEKFTNPVLLIHGRNDACIDYLYSMRYAVRYYNSRVHIIPSANHGYDNQIERDELYKTSLDFLIEHLDK